MLLGKEDSKLRVGFENPHKQHSRTCWIPPSGTLKHNIPGIHWACPPRFLVNPDWKMEAGSESKETHIQLQRESRTPEAIYHRKSDIPPNPYVASNAHDYNDGNKILVIPLDAINDETPLDDLLVLPGPNPKAGETTPPPLLPRDEVMGTAVALVALIKSKESGGEIDLELLIKLLSNPDMLDQLMKEHGHLGNQSSVITHPQPCGHSSAPFPNPRPAVSGCNMWSRSAPFSHSLSQGVNKMIEQICSYSECQNPCSKKDVDMGKIRKLINEYGVHLQDDLIKPGLAVVKDANYYRRLVLLYGLSQESGKPQGSVKPIGSQERRPCAYFNSPKGCRHGSSCRFQHVKRGLGGGRQGLEEQQGAKRVKLSGGSFARRT